jgi:hypothetical protein
METTKENPDLDEACAIITALFLDFLTIDIEDREWTRLQRQLANAILKIQNTARKYTDGK